MIGVAEPVSTFRNDYLELYTGSRCTRLCKGDPRDGENLACKEQARATAAFVLPLKDLFFLSSRDAGAVVQEQDRDILLVLPVTDSDFCYLLPAGESVLEEGDKDVLKQGICIDLETAQLDGAGDPGEVQVGERVEKHIVDVLPLRLADAEVLVFFC